MIRKRIPIVVLSIGSAGLIIEKVQTIVDNGTFENNDFNQTEMKWMPGHYIVCEKDIPLENLWQNPEHDLFLESESLLSPNDSDVFNHGQEFDETDEFEDLDIVFHYTGIPTLPISPSITHGQTTPALFTQRFQTQLISSPDIDKAEDSFSEIIRPFVDTCNHEAATNLETALPAHNEPIDSNSDL
ncbi:hypothetical protein G9A89_010416 [Geosiphon pyriformis]|nr:hypothetical protein G9A89_010416 [Geosiphon pyriformis]